MQDAVTSRCIVAQVVGPFARRARGLALRAEIRRQLVNSSASRVGAGGEAHECPCFWRMINGADSAKPDLTAQRQAYRIIPRLGA